jgi:hypothetical protein
MDPQAVEETGHDSSIRSKYADRLVSPEFMAEILPRILEAHRLELESGRRCPFPDPRGKATVHYTELGEMKPEAPIHHEWHTYLEKLPGWLAEGREGQFVLIKNTEVIDFFDSWYAADEVANQRFLLQHLLIHEIREREPLYRTRAV